MTTKKNEREGKLDGIFLKNTADRWVKNKKVSCIFHTYNLFKDTILYAIATLHARKSIDDYYKLLNPLNCMQII